MGQLIALVPGLAGCWVGQPTHILNISPVLHPVSLLYAVNIKGRDQLSCCPAPRAGLPTPIPPVPALPYCSGEAQGQICRVLQLRDRATSLAFVTIWVVSGVSSPILLPSELAPLCPPPSTICWTVLPRCDAWPALLSATAGKLLDQHSGSQDLRARWCTCPRCWGVSGGASLACSYHPMADEGWGRISHTHILGSPCSCQQGEHHCAAQVRCRANSPQCCSWLGTGSVPCLLQVLRAKWGRTSFPHRTSIWQTRWIGSILPLYTLRTSSSRPLPTGSVLLGCPGEF